LQADPGHLGLVFQYSDQVADPPVSGALVVPPSRVQVQDAAGIADSQGADPPGHRPGDNGFGGFVLGLADPPPVPRLGQSLAAPVMPPPPRPVLPGFRGAAGDRPDAALTVGQVHAVLGADRPSRHQQHLAIGPGHRVRVDDPRVDPRHPAWIRFLSGWVAGDRDFGGDIDPQPPGIVQQRDRPHLFWRVGQVPVQPHPQRRATAGGRDPQPSAGQREGAVVPAQRHQRSPPPREPRPLIATDKPPPDTPAQHAPMHRYTDALSVTTTSGSASRCAPGWPGTRHRR
jgi:hypothetical protein